MASRYTLSRLDSGSGVAVEIRLSSGMVKLRRGQTSRAVSMSDSEVASISKLRGFRVEPESDSSIKEAAKLREMPGDLLGALLLTIKTAIREAEPGRKREDLTDEYAGLMAELRRRDAPRSPE